MNAEFTVTNFKYFTLVLLCKLQTSGVTREAIFFYIYQDPSAYEVFTSKISKASIKPPLKLQNSSEVTSEKSLLESSSLCIEYSALKYCESLQCKHVVK